MGKGKDEQRACCVSGFHGQSASVQQDWHGCVATPHGKYQPPSFARGLPLPTDTFIGLFCVLGVDEPVQDAILLSKGKQNPHNLFGVGVDVEQSFHQAGLSCVRGCQLVHEEIYRRSQG